MANRTDVARMAGVSSTAVTGVLSGNPRIRVSPTTRKRVLETAQRLGYVPNVLAQGLNKRMDHIGVVVRHMYTTEHGLGEGFLEGIGQICEERGFFPVLCSIPADLGDAKRTADKLREFLASRRVSGLVIDKEGIPSDSVITLAGWEYPFVLVNGFVPSCPQTIYGVNVDDFGGGQMAVEHLVQRGHRRIALITRGHFYSVDKTNLRTHVDNQLRDGYWAGLKAAGLDHGEEMVQEGDRYDKGKVYQTLDRLLSLSHPPTAILTGDDRIAVMVVNGLKLRGLQAPRDMAVVGFGDTSAARLCEPDLTTIRLPMRQMTEKAAEILFDLIAGKLVKKPNVVLKVELIVRAST